MQRKKGREMKLPRGRRRTKRKKGEKRDMREGEIQEGKDREGVKRGMGKTSIADKHERWRREDMARWEREYGMKEQEIANASLLEATTRREATALQCDAALTSTTKQYGDTLKFVLPRMPSESA